MKSLSLILIYLLSSTLVLQAAPNSVYLTKVPEPPTPTITPLKKQNLDVPEIKDQYLLAQAASNPRMDMTNRHPHIVMNNPIIQKAQQLLPQRQPLPQQQYRPQQQYPQQQYRSQQLQQYPQQVQRQYSQQMQQYTAMQPNYNYNGYPQQNQAYTASPSIQTQNLLQRNSSLGNFPYRNQHRFVTSGAVNNNYGMPGANAHANTNGMDPNLASVLSAGQQNAGYVQNMPGAAGMMPQRSTLFSRLFGR